MGRGGRSPLSEPKYADVLHPHPSRPLNSQIMPRTANLEAPSAPSGPPPEQDVPLAVPPKTRLYVEQTQREREGAADMHRLFQRDLVRARLATARALVKVLTDGQVRAGRGGGGALGLGSFPWQPLLPCNTIRTVVDLPGPRMPRSIAHSSRINQPNATSRTRTRGPPPTRPLPT
jgi:hypothetical protein